MGGGSTGPRRIPVLRRARQPAPGRGAVILSRRSPSRQERRLATASSVGARAFRVGRRHEFVPDMGWSSATCCEGGQRGPFENRRSPCSGNDPQRLYTSAILYSSTSFPHARSASGLL